MASKVVLSAKGLSALASRAVTVPNAVPAPVAPTAPSLHAPELTYVPPVKGGDWPLGYYMLKVSPLETAQESSTGKSWDVAKINATFDNCRINGQAIRISGTMYVSKGLNKAEKAALKAAREAREAALG